MMTLSLQQAEHLALHWSTNPRLDRFIVDVEKADALFKACGDKDYVGRGEEALGHKGAISRFYETYEKCGPEGMPAPFVVISPTDMMIIDGRHRFAILRDLGVRKMLLTGIFPSSRAAKYHGILIEDKETNNA